MSRLVYLTRNYKSTAGGAGKARTDVEDILAAQGAVNLGLKRTYHHNKAVDFLLNLAGIVCFTFRLRRGDIVVLQYPVKKYYTLLCRIAHLRGAKVVSLVHDLGSFRRKRVSVGKEIKRLSHSDVLIVANANTVEWLKSKGLKTPMVEQVAWDFLSEAMPSDQPESEMSVAFIGTLSMKRNSFLYQLPETIELHLYGGGGDASLSKEGRIVHGFALPDELISHAKGRYGLIWYGSSTKEHIGYIGEYIKYCNPHKLALYMRAGKPVIMWRESGAADFVEREGIGITVDNLDDLDMTLKSVTEEEYATMMNNIRRVAARMAEGAYMKESLDKAVKLLSDDNESER
ncbi:MAG: galactofuranosyltransferase [Muribaculaceae bacterium]|nr:galactofuranosyltransferase [Muribaculaceae bacterium]